MLTYSFSDIGSDSLYEHLYKCIRNDITQGILKPGDKLPSKRTFAKNLGISVITIENAYDQLISEGYVYSICKKGYFVADFLKNIKSKIETSHQLNTSIQESESLYIADFVSNRTLKEYFPFTIWAKILRECLHDYQDKVLVNTPSGGALVLRKAIAKHLHDFRGMNVDPEQIVVGTGTEYLYGQIVQLLGHDKIYGVEDPGYFKMASVYEANGVKVKYIKMDSDGISVKELENENISVAHISPSHQFPTGVITSISKRYELLSWAAKADNRYIIEDDYDSEFRMIGRPIPTLQSIDTIEKVIYLNTFSKSITPTLRISYMVLPKQLVNVYYNKLSFYSCPVTTLIQIALARFISEGYFEKHINRMRNYYKKQRDLLVNLFNESEVRDRVKICEEDAGLHFVIRLDIEMPDKEFVDVMLRNSIRLSALSEYYFNNQNKSEHAFVINYSSLTVDQIRKAIDVMTKVIVQCKSKKKINKT